MLTMEIGLAEKIKKESTPKTEKIPSQELLNLKMMLQQLKNKDLARENIEEYKQISRQTYKDLCSFFINNGAEFITDVNKIYKGFNGAAAPLIVRREDPEKTIALTEDFDINLSFDPKVAGDRGDKYVNCAIWPYGNNAVSGIKNAFLEGRGMAGPIVSLMAARQNINNTTLEKPDDSLLKIGDIEREAVRIASGVITKEDLKFIILRIQKDFFPAESLTDEEKNENVKQIFRGFNF